LNLVSTTSKVSCEVRQHSLWRLWFCGTWRCLDWKIYRYLRVFWRLHHQSRLHRFTTQKRRAQYFVSSDIVRTKLIFLNIVKGNFDQPQILKAW